MFQHNNFYSVRNDLTGFADAARKACVLTVRKAMTMASRAERMKRLHCMEMRKAKSSSHLFMLHHASGKAMREEMRTRRIKSFESRAMRPCTDAPSTLRMPISLVRLSAV